MSAQTLTRLICDECGVEEDYECGVMEARRRARSDGWATGRASSVQLSSMYESRVDICANCVPFRVVAVRQ